MIFPRSTCPYLWTVFCLRDVHHESPLCLYDLPIDLVSVLFWIIAPGSTGTVLDFLVDATSGLAGIEAGVGIGVTVDAVRNGSGKGKGRGREEGKDQQEGGHQCQIHPFYFSIVRVTCLVCSDLVQEEARILIVGDKLCKHHP